MQTSCAREVKPHSCWSLPCRRASRCNCDNCRCKPCKRSSKSWKQRETRPCERQGKRGGLGQARGREGCVLTIGKTPGSVLDAGSSLPRLQSFNSSTTQGVRPRGARVGQFSNPQNKNRLKCVSDSQTRVLFAGTLLWTYNLATAA